MKVFRPGIFRPFVCADEILHTLDWIFWSLLLRWLVQMVNHRMASSSIEWEDGTVIIKGPVWMCCVAVFFSSPLNFSQCIIQSADFGHR